MAKSPQEFIRDPFWHGFNWATRFYEALLGKPIDHDSVMTLFNELEQGHTTLEPTPEEGLAKLTGVGGPSDDVIKEIMRPSFEGDERRSQVDFDKRKATEYLDMNDFKRAIKNRKRNEGQ